MTEHYGSNVIEVSHPRPGLSLRLPRYTLFGIHLHAMTKQDLLSVVSEAILKQVNCVIANHNMHSLYLYTREPQMRAFYSAADYVQIDGMPLIWIGRLLALPLRAEHRTTNLDLLPLLFGAAAARRWKVFYLGSKPGVAEKGARMLRSKYPGLQIAAHDGYFDTKRYCEDNQSVLDDIRAYGPDVLMVGMGMPRQEIWVKENLQDLAVSAIFCCGGLMDLVAGEIPTPPRWLGAIGLEWLFRLISQPVRTWRRYLLEPWVIVFGILANYRRSRLWNITINAHGDAAKRKAVKS